MYICIYINYANKTISVCMYVCMYICSGRKVYKPAEIGFFRTFPVLGLAAGDFHMLALCDVTRITSSTTRLGYNLVCMYVCMYVCIHAYVIIVSICTYPCMHVCMYVFWRFQLRLLDLRFMYSMYVCMYVCVYVCMSNSFMYVCLVKR